MVSAVVHSSDKMTWETPDNFLELVRQVSREGCIELDPCTTRDNPTRAIFHFTPDDDGLTEDWSCGGLVFCNPPYGRALGAWAAKMVEEARLGCEILALVPARTGVRWFQPLWAADELLMWRGRIKFKGATAGAPFDSAVAYFGPRSRRFREVFGPHGQLVRSAA